MVKQLQQNTCKKAVNSCGILTENVLIFYCSLLKAAVSLTTLWQWGAGRGQGKRWRKRNLENILLWSQIYFCFCLYTLLPNQLKDTVVITYLSWVWLKAWHGIWWHRIILQFVSWDSELKSRKTSHDRQVIFFLSTLYLSEYIFYKE